MAIKMHFYTWAGTVDCPVTIVMEAMKVSKLVGRLSKQSRRNTQSFRQLSGVEIGPQEQVRGLAGSKYYTSVPGQGLSSRDTNSGNSPVVLHAGGTAELFQRRGGLRSLTTQGYVCRVTWKHLPDSCLSQLCPNSKLEWHMHVCHPSLPWFPWERNMVTRG